MAYTTRVDVAFSQVKVKKNGFADFINDFQSSLSHQKKKTAFERSLAKLPEVASIAQKMSRATVTGEPNPRSRKKFTGHLKTTWKTKATINYGAVGISLTSVAPHAKVYYYGTIKKNYEIKPKTDTRRVDDLSNKRSGKRVVKSRLGIQVGNNRYIWVGRAMHPGTSGNADLRKVFVDYSTNAANAASKKAAVLLLEEFKKQ